MNSLRATPVEIKWHSGLPIYASEAFLNAVGDEYGWMGGTGDAGQLRCILPYTIIRKFGFRLVYFRVETIPLDGALDVREEKSFLDGVVEYFCSTGADVIIPSGNSAIFRTYPDCASAAPYGTFIKDLNQPGEVLESEIHKTFRYNIRRALKDGVQIKIGMEYLDTAYNLVLETLRRSKLKLREYNEFKRILLSLGENVRIFVAEYQGVVQGCMVAPFSEYSAYTWYCGSRPEPALGAMHLLHWEAIRHFRGMGVKRFDFQGVRLNPEKGSKQEGIMNFKMRFGGRLAQGYTWKCSLRPFKCAAYSLAVRVFRGGDTVDQERHKLASVNTEVRL